MELSGAPLGDAVPKSDGDDWDDDHVKLVLLDS